MSTAAAIRGMLAAGLTVEQALIAVEQMEQAKGSAAKSNAERQAAWRARQKAVTNNGNNVTPVTGQPNAPAHAHAELEPKNLETPYLKTPLKGVKKGNGPTPLEKPKSDRAECIAALAAAVSEDRAVAVFEHRAKLRKPLTPHAAGLLANSLRQAPIPNDAADEMIERGWQAWKPGWGQSRGPPGNGPPRRGTAALDSLTEFERITQNVQQFPRLTG